MDTGLLILRIVVGLLLVGHGTQKLFGWFEGHGLEGTGGFFAQLGYPRGKELAALAGLGEAGGGALLALGLLTPLGAAAIIGVMLNAILAVHADKGPWNTNGGYELPLTYATVAAAIAFIGPGAVSVDNAIGLTLDGAWWGLATIGLGLVSGLIVNSLRHSEPAAEETQEGRRAA